MKMAASGEECLTVARILDAAERSADSGLGEAVSDGL